MALLSLAAVARAETPRVAPGPFVVNLASEADGKPVAMVAVRLGGRMATSDHTGAAVFDGVPAGDYVLEIAHPGFDREKRGVRLPAGARDPLGVRLTPTVLAPVKGQAVLDGDGRAVAGVRLLLEPLAVRAAVQGPCAFASGWDGQFSVPALPAGKYRLRATAWGCRPREIEVEIKTGMEALTVAMMRAAKAEDLDVTVLDAESGAPLNGARVVLAEAWPRGIIAEGRTDGAGKFVAAGTPVGQLNWETELPAPADGSLPPSKVAVTRGAWTAQAEIEGYEPREVAWRPGEERVVRLHRVRRVVEQEPNDDAATARIVTPGATMECKFGKAGDHDCFRFRMPFPGKIRLQATRPADVWMRVILQAVDGTKLAEWGVSAADATPLESDWVDDGEYVLLIRQWDDNLASTGSALIRLSCAPAPDPGEPNDAPSVARLLLPGQEARGWVCPAGDDDLWRFEMKRPGHVRFITPAHPLWKRMAILDSNGKQVAERGVAGNVADLTACLMPGEYFLRIIQWDDNAASLAPWSARMEMIEDDGVDDTENGLRAARPLELGALAGTTIFPEGDRDTWVVSVPGPGRLHVGLSRSLDIWMRLSVLDSRGNARAETGVAAAAGELTADTQGPETLFIQIRQWDDDKGSTNPFLVSTWFEPSDEMEALGRNDAADAATPVELGEVLRGTLHPDGDEDWFLVVADHAGALRLHGIRQDGPWSRLQLFDARLRQVGETGLTQGPQPFDWAVPVLAGQYYVRVVEWDDRKGVPFPYELRVDLDRVEPGETEPLASDPVRALKKGEAQSYFIDQSGDRDTFVFDIGEAGKFRVRVRRPEAVWVRALLTDDRTGEQISEWGVTVGEMVSQEAEAKGPTRYRLVLRQWDDDKAAPGPGYLVVDTEDRAVAGETVSGAADPCDPTLVTFARRAVPGMARAARVDLDADGNGTLDAQVPPEGGATFRYSSEGLHRATAFLQAENGCVTRVSFWVEAIGPAERRGIRIVVDRPGEGQVVESEAPVSVRAISFSGTRIAGVSATVDGKALPANYTAPYRIEVPWRTLGGGEHVLTVTATDTAGEKATVRRTFRLSEYFGLLPLDGAALSGNSVRVTWTGGSFGPAIVRFRPRGTADWKQVTGESGRDRAVSIPDLEAGVPFEIQPLGGAEPGPVRTVTRVKGLAFGRARYGANIRRDYDQKVMVSVRNHADKPLQVTLVCGKPSTADLLVSFVGEGSEDRPVELGSGEEREFTLVFSAQDAVHPLFRVPLRISSGDAFSDETEIEVNVHLPEVKLEWEGAGLSERGYGLRLRLTNKGDGLTDLAVRCDGDDLTVSPAVEHGIFPAGAAMEFVVLPHLREGFRRAEGTVTAGAVGKEASHKVSVALKDGEQVYRVWVTPGGAGMDPDQADLMRARLMSAAYLSPAYVDWSKGSDPADTNGDGSPDRWTVVDRLERIRWVGDDTDGDGKVDQARGDVGLDGQFDWAGIRGEKGWEETNLADAWLEMGFQLRGPVESYKPHDVDLVLNDKLVGSLKNTLPQGNFRFRIPASAFTWGADGSPEGNAIGIRSRHLPGGHYAVTSDFRMKIQLTGTMAYVVAGSPEEAQKKIGETPGLSTEGADFSLASQEIVLVGPSPLKAGDVVRVTVPVRNLGALAGHAVPVAVFREDPGSRPIELSRAVVDEVPAGAAATAEIPVRMGAGTWNLKVVVDPERVLPDLDRDNDSGTILVNVAGAVTKPEVKVLEPAEGARLEDTVAKVRAEVSGSRADIRADRGPWKPLVVAGGACSTAILLQPGPHALSVRVLDAAGNPAEATVNVTVAVATPEARIVEPADGATIDARAVEVRIAFPEGTALASVRVNGGPWKRAFPNDGVAAAEVELTFGPCLIEAMIVNARGVRAMASCRVTCTKQREEGDGPSGPGTGTGDGDVDVDGFGPVDEFGNDGAPTADGEGGDDEPEPPADELPPDEGPQPLDDEAMKGLDEEEQAEDTDDETLDPEDWLTGDGAEDPEDEEPEDFSDDEDDSELPGDVDEFEHPDGDLAPEEAEAPPEEAGESPSSSGPPAGGNSVAVQQRQTDWYCTNRPNINARFQLPAWLKKLKLDKPGTPEYDAAVKNLLEKYRKSGIDTSALEKFQQALRRRAGSLQMPDELPGFFESLGLAGPKPKNEAELKEMREKVLAGVDSWYLRLLSSGDPKLIAEGLKARGEAIGQFDRAMQDSAEAAISEIKGNQKLVEDVLSAVPHTNLAMFVATWNEKESLSGEEITKVGRFVNGVFALGWGVGKLFQNPLVRGGLSSIGNKSLVMGQRALSRLAARLKLPEGKLRDSLTLLRKGLENLRGRINGGLEGRLAKAASGFAKSPAGQAAKRAAQQDAAHAERLLHRIAQANAAGDKRLYRQLVLQLQTNKTAQALLNSAKYAPRFRSMLDKTHRAFGRLTDREVTRQVLVAARNGQGEAGAALQRILRRNPGMKAGDVMLRARTVTGVKAGMYGRDRDVVYQWVTRDGRVLGDVHHGITGPVYDASLRRLTGRTAQELDHLVTSRWHPEAYNPGRFRDPRNAEKVISEIISGKRAGHLARPQDLRDTVIHKGRHWFGQAAAGGAQGNRAMGEGMRQAIKDYERHVAGYLKNRGLDAAKALPPRLKNGLDVFRKVQDGLLDGSCTVEQAQVMLRALGRAGRSKTPVTPQTIVDDLGHYVEFINKWGLHAGN
ncbi:MAG: hypothetical protein HYY18_18640 [Planctomycetes bacterium]|nr:hypothetical protein [Planctomycetota bacterium]